MSPKKQIFEEPIVRVDISRARFPGICPVCGQPATTTSRLTIASGKQRYLRYDWDPYHHPQVRRKQSTPEAKPRFLFIQVCEYHDYTDESENRYKTLCLIVDGFAMAFMLFALLFLGDSLSRSSMISPWIFLFSGIFVVSMIFSAIAFRPNPLARAVRIVGFDAGMQNALLAFKEPSYRNEFVKENPMTSELVTWIMKSE
jgi:hypothetical protein